MTDDDLVIEYSDVDYDAYNDRVIEDNWAEYVRHCNVTGERPTRHGCLGWARD